MFQNFRHAATWVHTWFGLVLGYVLIVCFFFGSLSVFDREIDRWAIPASRFAPQHMPSFDKVLRAVLIRLRGLSVVRRAAPIWLIRQGPELVREGGDL